ncbi:MAG: glycosyltransferase [Nitrososphaeria archaeon]
MNGISIIITAYNRDNFIHEAVKSILRQHCMPEHIEIIIVSNFDLQIDDGDKVEIRKIKMEGKIGEYLHTGITSAKYDIIAFLEDDDLWEKDKICRILNVFKDDAISYYHNQVKYINEDGEMIEYARPVEKNDTQSLKGSFIIRDEKKFNFIKWLLNKQADFNLSSMVIRKPFFLPFLDDLKKITACPDGFFFWSALLGKGSLYIDGSKLTKYRIHQLNTTGGNFKSKASEKKRMTKTYKILLNKADALHPDFKAWLELLYDENEFLYLFFYQAPKSILIRKMERLVLYPANMQNTLRNRELGIGILYILSKKMASKVYWRFASI